MEKNAAEPGAGFTARAVWSLVLLMIVVGGCIPPAYVVQDGPVAEVEFVIGRSNYAPANRPTDATFYVAGSDCKKKTLGMLGAQPGFNWSKIEYKEQMTHKVEAGHPIVLSVGANAGSTREQNKITTKHCWANIEGTLRPGHKYKLVYTQTGASCFLSVYNADPGGDPKQGKGSFVKAKMCNK